MVIYDWFIKIFAGPTKMLYNYLHFFAYFLTKISLTRRPKWTNNKYVGSNIRDLLHNGRANVVVGD
jgi:hypothetical protein